MGMVTDKIKPRQRTRDARCSRIVGHRNLLGVRTLEVLALEPVLTFMLMRRVS